VLVGYGSASAQDACPQSYPQCDSPDPGTGTPPPPDLPTVVSTFPKDGATNIDRDTNIKAEFSEKMMKSSVNRAAFRLYKGNLTNVEPTECDDQPGPGDLACAVPIPLRHKVSYNAEKNLAILNPVSGLRANTTYTAVVEGAGDTDGQAVKDKEGNEMATDYIWHFTTGSR
jgi:hypothetical protein